MRVRLLGTAVAAACVTLLSLPAGAAPATSCALLTDAAGDTDPATPLGPEGPLDLLSASAGAVGGDLVVELRVADLAAADPQATSGRTYGLDLSIADRRGYHLGVSVMPDGTAFDLFGPDTSESPADPPSTHNSPYLTRVQGVLDLQRSVLRAVLPQRVVLVSPGVKVRLEHAYSARAVGFAGVGLVPAGAYNTTSTTDADDMDGGGTYRFGAPSCVR